MVSFLLLICTVALMEARYHILLRYETFCPHIVIVFVKPMDLNLIYHFGTILPRYADIYHIYLTYSSRIRKLRRLALPFLGLKDLQISISPIALSSCPNSIRHSASMVALQLSEKR